MTTAARSMSNDDLGTCDRCGGTIGDTGWMKPTGRFDDEFNAPIVEMFCEDCALGGGPSE